ncbi:MAG: phage tail protein [Bacteroidia bacterium]
MALGEYPPVGFHFSVVFQLVPSVPGDIKFQEVSGLSVDMEMESYVEGGENRFTHQLPTRTRFSDLILKRGIAPVSSGVFLWARNAIELFEFQPANLTVSLLNDKHAPVASWYVVNAIPRRWEVSAFNAEQSSVVIETMTLSYQYFRNIRLTF